MQFFGAGKRTTVEKLLTSSWKTPEERDALIVAARELGLKAAEAVPLILCADVAVRQLGADIFLTRADGPGVGELLDRTQNEAPHIKGYASRVLLRLGPEVAQRTLDGLLSDKTAVRKRQGWELFAQLSGEWRFHYFAKAMAEAPSALRAPLLLRFAQEPGIGTMIETLLPLASDSDSRVAAIALEADSRLDISHESLIRQWATLTEWAAEEAVNARELHRMGGLRPLRLKSGASGINGHSGASWWGMYALGGC